MRTVTETHPDHIPSAPSQQDDRGAAGENARSGAPVELKAALAVIGGISALVALAVAPAWVIGLAVAVLLAIAIPPLRREWLRWPTDWKACAIASAVMAAGAFIGFLVGDVTASPSRKSATSQVSSQLSTLAVSYPLLPSVAGDRALRIAFEPTEPTFYSIAFRSNIGKPAEGVEWRQLHERGGVDVSLSTFALTLTNRSRLPLTVTDIVVELISASPPPTGWIGGRYPQGAGNLDQYRVFLDSEAPGSQAVFHWTGLSHGSYSVGGPFFATHQITLKPGEIYDADVNVQANVHRELKYRFIVSGNTASESFTIPVSPKGGYRISGEQVELNPNAYTLVGACWAKSEEVGAEEVGAEEVRPRVPKC
jgi:hypothetical protein